MVDAQTVIRELGMGRTTFYRLLNAGQIPYHVEESDRWRRRGAYRFDLAEVKEHLQRRGRVPAVSPVSHQPFPTDSNAS